MKGISTGVMYNKSVSVFSDDDEEVLPPNYNILDVYIG